VRNLLYFFIIVIAVMIGCSNKEVIKDVNTKETVENVQTEGFTVVTHLWIIWIGVITIISVKL
jgi:hypothetical protein